MDKMVDEAFDYTQNARDLKIWQEMSENVLDSFKTPLLHHTTDAKQVYNELKTIVLPYPMGNIHRRFWA